MPPIRVVIAEGHSEYQEMLCEQLRRAPDLDIIGNVRDGWEVITAVGRLKPDVLTLDLDLPGMSGLDVLHVIRWLSSDTKVIILSDRDEESLVQAALRQGAWGYLAKGEEAALPKAIRVVHAGEMWATRRVLAAVIEELRRLAEPLVPTTKGEVPSPDLKEIRQCQA